MPGIAFGIGLLQTRVNADNIARNLAELIARKRLDAMNLFPVFYTRGKTVKPAYMLPYPAGGKPTECTHGKSNQPHHPKEAVVGPQQVGKRQCIWHRCSHYAAVGAAPRRIKICSAGAAAVATLCKSAAMQHGLLNLAAVEMVR